LNPYIKSILPNLKKNTQFTIKANLTYRNNMIWNTEYSDNFLAILRTLKLHLLSDNKFMNYEMKEYPNYNNNKESILFIELGSKYIINNIKIFTTITSTFSDKNDYEYITLELQLSTIGNANYKILEQFINMSIDEYKEERLDNIKTQHIFIFDNIKEENSKPIYQEFPFETTKNFDNMYFDEKQDVLNRIDYFIKNKDEYKRLGIPYTFGLLLHGIPGTSKTGFVKALAKYTKRHCIILPTKKITNIDILKRIFLDEEINGIQISNEKRLYIFEDIDCGSWKDIVKSRIYHKDNKDNADQTTSDVFAEVINKLAVSKDENDEKTKHNSLKNEKNIVTLGDFLELLDGIIEINGRMLVMTTNHPEMLDPALIRPGRIDIMLEFKKLSKQNIYDMYYSWFNKTIPSNIYDKIKDNVFTLAELGNIFAKYRLDLSELNKHLCP